MRASTHQHQTQQYIKSTEQQSKNYNLHHEGHCNHRRSHQCCISSCYPSRAAGAPVSRQWTWVYIHSNKSSFANKCSSLWRLQPFNLLQSKLSWWGTPYTIAAKDTNICNSCSMREQWLHMRTSKYTMCRLITSRNCVYWEKKEGYLA